MYAMGNSTTPNLSNYCAHICRPNTGKIEEILLSDDPGKHRNSSLDTYNCHDGRPTGASNLWIMFGQTNLPIFPFRQLGGMASGDEYSGRPLVEYDKKSMVG